MRFDTPLMAGTGQRTSWAVLALIAALAAGCTTGGSSSKKNKDVTQSGDTGGGGDTGCSNGTKDGDETDVDCGGACGSCGDGKSCAVDADCGSGECGVTYTCVSAACANGKQDPKETGIDCGGDCLLCPGDKCSADDQCTTGFCKTGVCDTPSCTDGLKNGAETGVDCGGDCGPCGDGQGCVTDANCTSGFCNASDKCATPSCDDGEKNAKETDVDCGADCGPCADGKACAEKTDCTSGKCEGGVCKALGGTCDNGEKDGDETDVDCGGSCSGCGSAKACTDGEDCASGTCQGGKCTVPATCQDAALSPGETDVDCGGDACDPCGLTKACKAHSDCLSYACILGICKEPACDDGVMNGAESDQDCGSDCPACGDGKMCKADTDCEGGNCTGGFCGSCTDGKKNGAETDTDCGGPCDPCDVGKTCDGDADCESNDCSSGTCVSCNDKIKNGLESDIDCGGGCDACPVDKACNVDTDCALGACSDAKKCCAPNACGTCGALPEETCNGVDDDCDDQTDEGLTAQKCTNQKGVCAGSLATCEGEQGWVCTDATYQAFSADWVKTESVCDKLDNDCDGQTDEGDCAACGAAVVLNKTFMGAEFSDLRVGYDWLAVLGETPTAALSAYQGGFSFSRGAYTVTPTDYDNVEAYGENGPSLATDGMKLYMAMRQNLSSMPYVQVGPIEVGLNDYFTAEVPSGEHSTPIAVGGGKMAFSYVDGDANYQMMAGVSDSLAVGTSFDTFVLEAAGFDNAVAVAVTNDGVPHFVFRESFGNGALVHQTAETDREEIAPAAGYPDVAAAPDGTLWVAYKATNSASASAVLLLHRTEDGTWEAPITVGTGVTRLWVAVTVDDANRPIVGWVEGSAKIHLVRVDDGKVVDLGSKTMDPAKADSVAGLEIEAAAGGVIHVVTWLDYLDTQAFAFSTTCKGYGDGGTTCTPSCTGKQCGDDGCGGSCGTCGAGKSCNASGQCVAGCTPSCAGKDCGDDGCGGSCGICAAGSTCNTTGQCETTGGSASCSPDDPECRACVGAADSFCNSDWDAQCIAECTSLSQCNDVCGISACVPSCTGKKCGDDGCGGSCGTCAVGQTCNASGQCQAGSSNFGLPASCASTANYTINCNPLTNQGCTQAGYACDLGTGVLDCYPPPNTVPLGGTCPAGDAFCVPGAHCTATSAGTCKKFCCSNADCGGATCAPLDAAGLGTLGLCP